MVQKKSVLQFTPCALS